MKFGVVVRTDIPLTNITDLAQEGETSGWDGFFLWDSFAGQDPWVLLTSVALHTERIRSFQLLDVATVQWLLDAGCVQ